MHGRLRVYLGSAPGVGKTYAMLNEGWRRRERGTDVVIGLVVTHEPAGDDCPDPRPGGRGASSRQVSGSDVGRDGCRRHHRPRPSRGPGGRARAHERARLTLREALAGHRGIARRGNRSHLDVEHPASREPQRCGQPHHGGDAERDGPGRRGPPGRSGRAHRHEPRGAATSDGPRQHLCAGEGRRRARELLPPREPRRVARACTALGSRSCRGLAAALHGTTRHHDLMGDPRAGARRGDRGARLR